MKNLHESLPVALLTLMTACGGGGGNPGASALLPGAARYEFEGIDVEEAVVAGSHGEALPSGLLLGGGLLSPGFADDRLWHARLDGGGQPVAAHQVVLPTGWIGGALQDWSLEHRGAGSSFHSRVHVWGGARATDGGWCSVIDANDPCNVVDTVLFEDGSVGALLASLDPVSGACALSYEEFLPDGSLALSHDLPGSFLSPNICSIGLVQRPDGLESTVIAALQGTELATWIGVIDRPSGDISVTRTATASPTEVTGLEVVDAYGANSAWVVATRSLSGTPLVEAIQIRTTDDLGQPLLGAPAVAHAQTVSFLAASGYVGLEPRHALHGAEAGPDSADTLFLACQTQDTTASEARAVWVAWEAGAVNATWATIAAGVSSPSLHCVHMAPSGAPGRVAVAANVVSPSGEFSTIVGELDAASGAAWGGRLHDTAMFVETLQATSDGLLLHRRDVVAPALEVEGVRGDMTFDFAAALTDGVGDSLLELEGVQRAYSERGLMAGGSDQGLYVLDVVDPLARADASSIVTELPPASGPEAAFLGSSPFVVGLANGIAVEGTEPLVFRAPRLVPRPVTPLGITAKEL